jgi:hypothetical protein
VVVGLFGVVVDQIRQQQQPLLLPPSIFSYPFSFSIFHPYY